MTTLLPDPFLGDDSLESTVELLNSSGIFRELMIILFPQIQSFFGVPFPQAWHKIT